MLKEKFRFKKPVVYSEFHAKAFWITLVLSSVTAVLIWLFVPVVK